MLKILIILNIWLETPPYSRHWKEGLKARTTHQQRDSEENLNIKNRSTSSLYEILSTPPFPNTYLFYVSDIVRQKRILLQQIPFFINIACLLFYCSHLHIHSDILKLKLIVEQIAMDWIGRGEHRQEAGGSGGCIAATIYVWIHILIILRKKGFWDVLLPRTPNRYGIEM